MEWLARIRRQTAQVTEGGPKNGSNLSSKRAEGPLPLWDPTWVPEGPIDLPALCYRMAYLMLPALAYEETETTLGYFLFAPQTAASYFYAHAVDLLRQPAQWEHARDFRAHRGQLAPGWSYFVLQYPAPPPLMPNAPIRVLAPFFSAILQHAATDTIRYYVLGQSATRSEKDAAPTTLRQVTQAGIIHNLGRGSKPELETFLQCLREKANLDTSRPQKMSP